MFLALKTCSSFRSPSSPSFSDVNDLISSVRSLAVPKLLPACFVGAGGRGKKETMKETLATSVGYTANKGNEATIPSNSKRKTNQERKKKKTFASIHFINMLQSHTCIRFNLMHIEIAFFLLFFIFY